MTRYYHWDDVRLKQMTCMFMMGVPTPVMADLLETTEVGIRSKASALCMKRPPWHQALVRRRAGAKSRPQPKLPLALLREKLIMPLVAEGLTNRIIARRLKTGEHIVKHSLAQLQKQRNAKNRVHLAVLWERSKHAEH